MTFTITKTKLALSILVAALLVPATAWASHVFDDVPDDKFYAGPVEWAFDNNITTGKTATSFAPDDNVTRGESVTFLQRYNDNIVDPALNDLESDIADIESDVAEVPTTYWAWVTSGGALFNNTSSDGVSATKDALGEYTVVFPVEVNGCSWSVAHRSVDGLIVIFDPDYTNEASFDLSTRVTGLFPSSTSHPTDVKVRVTDPDGNPANSDFNLQVTCFPS